jgi:hypothetical protein
MTVRQTRYSKEKFAQRGDEIYETQVRPQVVLQLSTSNEGQDILELMKKFSHSS